MVLPDAKRLAKLIAAAFFVSMRATEQPHCFATWSPSNDRVAGCLAGISRPHAELCCVARPSAYFSQCYKGRAWFPTRLRHKPLPSPLLASASTTYLDPLLRYAESRHRRLIFCTRFCQIFHGTCDVRFLLFFAINDVLTWSICCLVQHVRRSASSLHHPASCSDSARYSPNG